MTTPMPEDKAWVVFINDGALPILSLLKPGFRHCYLLLRERGKWMTIDPTGHYLEVKIHDHLAHDFDLPVWMRSQGQIVVPAKPRWDHTRCAPFNIFSCVETVKRYLGIHKRWILTPYQLYEHLTKEL